MNLGLSEDQLAIEEAFTRLFVNESPPAVARAAEPLGFDRRLWDRLVDMGAPGMGVAEESGGGGATLSDLVVVAEAVGHAIAPVPLIEHLVAARAHPVDDVVEGAAIATISLRPARPDGTWRLVPAGAIADVVIGVDGDELVAVRSPAPGEAPRNHAAAPIADRSARVGERTVLGPAGDFARALERMEDADRRPHWWGFRWRPCSSVATTPCRAISSACRSAPSRPSSTVWPISPRSSTGRAF